MQTIELTHLSSCNFADGTPEQRKDSLYENKHRQAPANLPARRMELGLDLRDAGYVDSTMSS